MNQCYSSQTEQCYSSWMDQCYSSMLQLSFIYKIKENTSSRCEGLLTQKMHREERESPALWLLFVYAFFSPWACPMQTGLAKSALCSTWGPHSSPCTFLCSIFVGFSPSLSFSHHLSGLLFPILTTSHYFLKRWEAQFFGSRVNTASLATSCWAGMARGIGPPILASLRSQSACSGVHLKVNDIFCGRL